MREHIGLFRGKRIDNGKWVEGYLVEALSGSFWIDSSRAKGIVRMDYVDPDSIGECTGLIDKNGKLIFEGDIVRGKDIYWESFTEKVEYIEGEWIPFYYIPPCVCEIIGNIHDNPELLKGGEGE